MTVIQAFILGIIQGATEFLPVSSSGHLVATSALLNWQFSVEENFIFGTLVQWGTLLSVIIYFWDDLGSIVRKTLTSLWQPNMFAEPEVRLGLYIVVASIPAGLAGLVLKDRVEAAFSSPRATAYFLLFTAGLLIAAEQIGKRSRKIEELTWSDALVMGVFQALALFPGVSRSGATITGGMSRHLERGAAARFSFLVSVPIMLAAGLWTAKDIPALPDPGAFWLPLLAGFISSAVVGYLAIKWLLGFLSEHPLSVFSYYLIPLSLILLIVV